MIKVLRKRNPGVYVIECITNGKKYIGSSVNPTNRLITHFRELRNNKHSNPHLQNSWNIYGEKLFVSRIIEDEIEEESLRLKETEYIIKFGLADPLTGEFFKDVGYNMSWPGHEGFKDPLSQKSGINHHLYGKINWKKGKTFDEIFSKEKAEELRANLVKIKTGAPSPKKYKHKHNWEEMSYNRQYKLWKNNDPMVPISWLPRQKGAH